MSLPAKNVRTSFTADEDTLLMKYIATYNPTKKNRSGNALYKCLEANVDNKWNWSRTHSWQSWQNRYRKNMVEFDRKILKYQKKKGIDPEKQSGREPQVLPSDEEAAKDSSKETGKGKKRAGVQDSTEQRKAKRVKLEKDQPDAGSSRSPLIKTDETRQIPAVGPSDQAHTSHPYEGPLSETVSDMPPPSPNPASTFNIPSLPSRSEILPVLSSQLNSLVGTLPPFSSQLPPSSQPLASSSQQVITPKPPSGPKRALKHASVSPIFSSLSPMPDRSPPLKKKALPKMVEGHFRRALTDGLGHVPGTHSETQMMVWPPVRSKKGKEKEVAQGPTALTPSAAQERERHPIDEVESRASRLAVVPPKCEPESQRPPAPLLPHRIEPEHHPFSQVPYPPPPHPPRNRSGADAAESPLKHRSANGVGHLAKSLWDRKRDNVMGSASVMAQPAAGPSKLTTAAVPSDLASSAEPPHGQPVVVPSSSSTSKENARLPNAPSLAQISTGSASSTTVAVQQTHVPLKEAFAPILDSNPIVQPQDRNLHLTVSAPRRSNMQPLPTPGSPFLPSNTDKSNGKRKQRHAEPPVTHARRLLNRTQKRRKTVGGYDLPRMDLRTLSAVPTSRIPRSRGSSSSSNLSHRHPLPVHSTPSAIPADLSGHLITPGPVIPPVPYALITPVDIPLSASVGFRSCISHIAASNGFSPDVVLEVYKRVGSLQATEECVRGMRNASERWIEAKLQQREREARNVRRASNERESRESDHSDDEPPRDSRHQPSLQQALPERRLPNGLRVRHEPGSHVLEYEPLPRKKAAPKKRASSGGDSMGASWRVGAVERYRTNQAEDEAAETDIDSSEGGDDEAASGEEDEESSDDVKQAEEESVVARLVSESPWEDIQDQDDPEYHTDNEPEPAPPDADQLDEDDRHHEFSLRELPRARIKRENLSPSLDKSHGDPAQDGEEALNGAPSDVRLTRSVSPTWNADEDITPLSWNGQVRQMLERRLGKQVMRKRVAQLLR